MVDLTTGKTAASLEHPVKGIRQRSRGDAGSDIVWELRNGHTEIWRAGNELAKLVDLGLAVEGATWFSERDWLLVWYGDGECGAIDLSWLESLRELEASGISFEGWRPLRDRLPLWTAGANPGEL
jgi:hypothetical protein